MSFLSRDAERFCEIANLISQAGGQTYSTLSASLDVSVGTIRSVLSRMSLDCAADVAATQNDGGAATLTLTETGKLLHNRLLKCIATFEEEFRPPQFSLAIAPTMISSGLLDGVLSSIRDLETNAFELSTKTQLSFDQIVAGIQDGSIDGAILWGVDQRLRKTPTSLHLEEIVSKVDVVVVARDKSIVDKVNPSAGWLRPGEAPGNQHEELIKKAMAELSTLRFASLPPESQAVNHLIPTPDRSKGGAKFEVDTIETALAFVRCQAADFAVVPAMYDRLERGKQHGHWFFSDPITQIPIVVISPKAVESDAGSVLLPLLNDLRWDTQELWRSRKSPTDKFPRSVGFYTKLRYGYYIGADVRVADAPLQWCWESIRLSSETTDRTRTLRGQIINQFNSQFEVTSAQFQDTFFNARVTPVGRGKNRMKEFLSRFHYCDFKSGTICGTWSGSARGDRSGVFATVWSHEKLDLSELTRVTQIADLHSVMSAQRGCEDKSHQTDLLGNGPLPKLGADSSQSVSKNC